MSPSKQLLELAGKLLDGIISPDECRRLNALLLDDEMQRLFYEFSAVHVALHRAQTPDEDAELVAKLREVHDVLLSDCRDCEQLFHAGSTAALELPSEGRAWPFARRYPADLRGVWLAIMGVAAVLALVAVTAALFAPLGLRSQAAGRMPQERSVGPLEVPVPNSAAIQETLPANGQFVARVIAISSDAQWDNRPRDFLLRLKAGSHIRPSSGLVEIEFSGGATVVIQGPAHLEVQGASQASLHAGSLTARSEPGSFELTTPAASLLDIGTAFGVSVAGDGTTDVEVLEGEVHVNAFTRLDKTSTIHQLTTGMAVRVDPQGEVVFAGPFDKQHYESPAHSLPSRLGESELSLVDVISGSKPGEYRVAGSIDPYSGHWGSPPWLQAAGVEPKKGDEQYVTCDWNSMVDGVFVPAGMPGLVKVDSHSHTAHLPQTSGRTWGPVWARRRLEETYDPAEVLDPSQVDEFWGAGSMMALIDRLDWSRDGLVGLHANVGITIDLAGVRRHTGREAKKIRGTVTHLEMSRSSAPLYPQA
jgi:ferric-dicitrate binding protein FerR (iron transport regulator)